LSFDGECVNCILDQEEVTTAMKRFGESGNVRASGEAGRLCSRSAGTLGTSPYSGHATAPSGLCLGSRTANIGSDNPSYTPNRLNL
jgi:hypothetical protein